MTHASDAPQREAAERMRQAVAADRDRRGLQEYRQDMAQNKVAATMQRVRYGAQEKEDACWEMGR